ncbi:acyl-CoA dehydrogenase family protein [Novosphingobium colocasiae]|uniref:Acyl-CoA dehydrogenase n=1 Tax=Novosphingobium colocasiae TaxID=1256513 RepID=A0A918UEF7_9SPHN|nr:acyl-CoA dehydrogenase family protein [Novosphingobium colocasiae]GGY95764.1 acyl-CoA dehydrogenase [Novosphingobium colocasiae]
MNFNFDEDQRSLGETVAAVLADDAQLLAPDPVEAGTSKAWEALAELGLFSLLVPEDLGGAGFSLIDVSLAIEALGAGLAPPGIASTLVVTELLSRYGSDQLKARWLPGIATGELHAALAIQEVGSGPDPLSMRTAFVANGLSGTKMLVDGGSEADLFLVLAGSADGPAVVVIDAKADGVSCRAHDGLDPSSALAEVTFDNVAVGDDDILGGAAAADAVATLQDLGATVAAGMQIGIAARVLDISVEYAKVRVQFGQPIGAFQGIKHVCADLAVAVESGRSAAYYAFWAVAEDAPDRARAASMAKAYCGEVARDGCNRATQIHGGMGFTWELALHRYMRRARILEQAFGNSDWHYDRVTEQTVLANGHATRDEAVSV